MNYTRRTWLTAAGAVGFSAALTRCGGDDPLSPTTTDAASAPLATAARSGRTSPTAVSGTTGRVVIVGGGMAGLAAAKYLKVWGGSGVQVTLIERNPSYTSNILSNLVLTGQRTLSSLVYSYATVKQNYGVDIRQGTVVGIDPLSKKVALADGSTLAYDRLIVAPGVVFDVLPGLETRRGAQPGRARVAGGPRNDDSAQPAPRDAGGRNLRDDDPRFAVSLPSGPVRARVRRRRLAEAKQAGVEGHRARRQHGIQAEKHTFETAFTGLFKDVVEYVPNAAVLTIDATQPRIVVNSQMGPVFGDVVNAIPPQRAGKIVLDTGLANAGGRWAGVKAATFESTVAAGVHVIGDSCSAGIPKAGHIGNQEGKTAADAILRAFRGLGPDTDLVVNSACYSPITASTASWLTAVYQYDASAGSYKIVGGSPSEATSPTSDGYSQMNKWFATLMGETFA